MPKTTRALNETRPQQSIEELQQRYQSLNEKRITAKTNLVNAENRLNELKAEARDKYGTDDIEKLQRMLQEMRAENELKRSSYQSELDRIEDAIAEVESSFEQANTPDEAN